MTLRPAVRFLLYAVLVFAPLARGGVQDWAVAVIQMLVLAAAGAYLVDAAWRWEWRWNRTALDGPLVAMFGLALVSTLFSVYPPASWRAMGLLATYLLFYGLAAQVFDSRRRRRELVWVVFGLAAVLTGIGFVKLLAPEWVPWWVYAEIGVGGRLTGPYGNPNHLGGFLMMALLLMLAWLGACRSSGERLIVGCLIAFCGVGLMMTLSRGAWMGLAAGVLWMGVVRWRRLGNWRRRVLPLIVGVGIALAMVLSSTSATVRVDSLEQGREELSLAGRMAAWEGVVELIRERPVLGSGPGTFSMVFPGYQPPGQPVRFFYAHNDWLEFAAELGLGVFVLLGWLGCRFFRGAWRLSRSRSRTKYAIAIGVGGAGLGILLHGLVDFNLQIPGNGFLLAALLSPLAAGLASTGNIFHVRQPEFHRMRPFPLKNGRDFRVE
jgi:O-antigen ligase